MRDDAVSRVGVVGGGLMGSGIAEVAGWAGFDVVCVEVSAAAADAAQVRITASIEKAGTRGHLTPAQVQSACARIRFTDSLEALADRQLVIEAATEHEATKLELFRRLARVVGDDAVLASNTSSIPIVKLGAASGRPSQVIGIHFFNPAPVMPLVELVPSLVTSERTLDRCREFVTSGLGKTPIVATDRAGFVVNFLLVPYLMSAVRLLEAGHASAEDIDQGMTLGCAHPMGPLALSDLIGLDTLQSIGETLYQEYKEPLYGPPPLLARMVAAGQLGRKSGRGFYGYEGMNR